MSHLPDRQSAGESSNPTRANETPDRIDLRLIAPARRNAPATSREAARRIQGVTGPRRRAVLGVIAQAGAGGLTDDEGERLLGWRSQSYTPRRRELAMLGLVRDSGRTRQTTSGRDAVVWVATGTEGGAR